MSYARDRRRPRRASGPRRPTGRAAIVELDLATGDATVAPAGDRRRRSIRADIVDRRARRVPDDRRPDRVRQLLRADEPVVPRPGRRAAAADRHEPRRPDRRGVHGASRSGTQLFTSRGFAVLDVDYGGCTGYGKAYRKRLEGEWGVVDVDDCVNGAQLARRAGPRRRRAPGDPRRQRQRLHDALRGDVPRRVRGRARSYFGIGDLETFVHGDPQVRVALLEQRSSGRGRRRSSSTTTARRSTSPSGSRAPVLVLQGAEDRIVPPAQAEQIVDALWERHLPHAYLLFPGEDHGFRGRGRTSSARSRRSCRSTARSSASSRPTRSSRSRSSSSTRPGQPRPEAWRPGDAAAPRHQRRRGRDRRGFAASPTQAIAVVLILLVAATALALVARRIGIPYPILLVLGGLALGFVPGLPPIELEPESSSCCSCRRSSSARATSPRSATSSATSGRSRCCRSGSSCSRPSSSRSSPRHSSRAWAGRRRSRSGRSSPRPTRSPRRRSSSGSACRAGSSRSSRARASSTTRRRSSPTASRSSPRSTGTFSIVERRSHVRRRRRRRGRVRPAGRG